ncbi:hypothetical protein RRG08_030067 [Elysia crispata]|uniref:Uncharacterized protein n=1 Tax=Elysia crispata TaxID=231223 RepID=A0AAE0YK29_9GAST|nr:hypothetical protein RRG08_030067 [Elysia crispata]
MRVISRVGLNCAATEAPDMDSDGELLSKLQSGRIMLKRYGWESNELFTSCSTTSTTSREASLFIASPPLCYKLLSYPK